MDHDATAARPRGRGVLSNRPSRFEGLSRLRDEGEAGGKGVGTATTITSELARSVVTRNDSPDLSFDRSLNPYRGCEHGCTYCFARQTHAYLGLSPGLDFERQIRAKDNAAAVLAAELDRPGYTAKPLAIGTNTDAYQPAERQRKLMRAILAVLAERQHPVGIVTKGALVTRDIDLLAPMAARGLAKVAISITTLDAGLARSMEPRASTPARRLAAIRTLAEAGIPVAVLVSPLIPGLNDHEIESILGEARGAGAREAGYGLLRLPLEVRDLFREWLVAEVPGRARRVLTLLRDMRGGRDNDPRFGTRQTGEGPLASLMGRRFEVACERLGLNREKTRLRSDLFRGRARAEQLVLL